MESKLGPELMRDFPNPKELLNSCGGDFEVFVCKGGVKEC